MYVILKNRVILSSVKERRTGKGFACIAYVAAGIMFEKLFLIL